MKESIFLSWSSGKDSAWSLHRLRQQQWFEPTGLVTAVNMKFERVSMHAVRIDLLKRQAQALEIPLYLIPLPHPCTNEIYEGAFKTFIHEQMHGKTTHLAFGDLFLEDIRAYREKLLWDTGIQPVFPLWQEPTGQLAREMIASGLKARISCINPTQLDPQFTGCEYDFHFLDALPSSVDPCGENGEFHTFAYDGPMFKKPISIATGKTIERDGFIFTDLLSCD